MARDELLKIANTNKTSYIKTCPVCRVRFATKYISITSAKIYGTTVNEWEFIAGTCSDKCMNEFRDVVPEYEAVQEGAGEDILREDVAGG